MVVGLEAEQVLTSCTAAAPDVAETGGGSVATGVEEGACGRRAMVRGEAVSEDGRLEVAQEKCIVLKVVESGVCHGENTVTFT